MAQAMDIGEVATAFGLGGVPRWGQGERAALEERWRLAARWLRRPVSLFRVAAVSAAAVEEGMCFLARVGGPRSPAPLPGGEGFGDGELEGGERDGGDGAGGA